MKRQKAETVSLVYAYGIGMITDGLQHVYAEQAKNRKLWDTLIDIDKNYDVTILAAASADDQRLVDLRDEIYFAAQEASAAIEARSKERKRIRSNQCAPSFDDAVTSSITRLKSAKKEFYGRLKTWRQANTSAIREFNERRYLAVKEARNNSGLYWPNYNRVIQSFEIGRNLVKKTGRRLRYSDPARQDGCLAVQIQRVKDELGAAPADLHTGRVSALQIAPVPNAAYSRETPRCQRRKLCQTTMRMRIDAEGHFLTARMWMHRPLPPDCRIKSAQLTWHDGGARGRKWQLALTISQPAREIIHPRANETVGIDVGWRLKEDGSLRVAYWVGSDGKHGELVLPKTWMDHQDWIEDTRSKIDTGAIQGEAEIRRHELLVKGGRSKDLGDRRERYRLFARQIAMNYGTVVVEHIELAMIAASKEHAGRSQRQRACIHQLLDEIKYQCAKHGARHLPMEGPSTMRCHACGKIGEPTDRAMLYWSCDGCDEVWDQDRNAAINLMLAATTASTPITNADNDSKNKILPIRDGRKKRTARKPDVDANDHAA